MIRVLVAAILLAMLVRIAVGSEPRLSLEAARAVVARAGVNVGTVFTDGQSRFVVSSVTSRSPRSNVFEVTVTVRPAR